jgi:hypothetical protein
VVSVEPVELPELEPVELSELEPVELDAVSVTVVIPVVVGACPAVPPQAALKSPSSRNFCGRPTGGRYQVSVCVPRTLAPARTARLVTVR